MVKAQFSVSWESFESNIRRGFSSLQQDEELVDLTIAADGHFVKVHKVVIALSSPYLKDLISSAPCQHPVIFLNNVPYTTFCSILEYIYTGDVVIPSSELSCFIKTAKALHIRGLENVETSNIRNDHEDFYYSDNGINITNSDAKRAHRKYEDLNEEDEVEGDDDEGDLLTSNIMDDEDYADLDSDQISDGYQNKQKEIDETEPDLQFTLSNRGCPLLILNRYMYNLHKSNQSGKKRWICIEGRTRCKRKCPAYVVTFCNTVIRRAKFHCHPFHDEKISAKIAKHGLSSTIEEIEEKSKLKFKRVYFDDNTNNNSANVETDDHET